VRDVHLEIKKEVGFQRNKHEEPNTLSNWFILIFMGLCKLKYLVNILTLSLSLMILVECVGLTSLRARMKHLTILREFKIFVEK